MARRWMRRLSSSIVTPQDIQELDAELIEIVRSNREAKSILIDSHAVTKEVYGFRATAFSVETLKELNPDLIICLYASDETILTRIQANALGGPAITPTEASMHTQLQMALAMRYGTILGRPAYTIDSAVNEEDLVRTVAVGARLEYRQ